MASNGQQQAVAAMGRALQRLGKKEGDLGLVRRGKALEAKAADKTKSAICSGCGGCNNCKPTHAAVPVVSAVEPDLRGLKPGDQIRIPYPKQGYSL